MGMPKGTKCRKWTPDEIAYIGEITPGRAHREIHELMNARFEGFSLAQIKSAIKRYGLNTGRTGYFEKGSTPASKGTTWDEFMPLESQAKCKATCFKPGDEPSNLRPIGSERVDSKDGYIYIKVAERYDPAGTNDWRDLWKLKHRVIWEEANGPVPDGHIVIFCDRDRTNCTLENLMCIPQSINAVINRAKLNYFDRQSAEAAIKTAELMSAIYKKECADKTCRDCGQVFKPKQPRQGWCRSCIDRRKSIHHG